jgi:hypothetical protein
MRIINVVTIKDGVVDEIESFGIFEEQLSDEVVEEAEKLFFDKAKALGYVEDEEDTSGNDELIDGGYFSIANASVCISWSGI